jgi:hypothetical protein
MQVLQRQNDQSKNWSETNTPDRLAINEAELATRWGLSVKTLRRWRQNQLGPIFCKLGSRVTYLLAEIEAFERRASRYSTFARANH